MVILIRPVKGLRFELSYLYADRLACYCFMDAARRHETPRSETKDFNAHTHGVCFSSSLPLSSMGGDTEGLRYMLLMQRVSVSAEEHRTWGKSIFWQAASLSCVPRET